MRDRLKALVRSLLLRRRLDEDMDDEMRFHIEQYRRDLVRNGVSPAEAASTHCKMFCSGRASSRSMRR